MIVLLTLAMLPVLLAQDQGGKAETCSYLASKISKLDDAITSSLCDFTDMDFAKFVISKECQTVSMTVIPPCMVKVGKAAQAQCMAEAMKVISQEYNAPEEEMTIVEQCKCDAFGKSRHTLAKAQEMLDCSSFASRKRRGAPIEPVHYQPQQAYPQAQPASWARPQPVYPQAQPAYHQPQPAYIQPQPAYPQAHPQQSYYQPQQPVGADTLWYQYSLCQEDYYYCHFFAEHWRSQGEFGLSPAPHGTARESRAELPDHIPDLTSYPAPEPTKKQHPTPNQNLHGYAGGYLTNK